MRIESETTSQPEDDRSLDRLLGEARWPDADQAAIARLRMTLAAESHQIAAKSQRWWGVAIAAGVGIALIGGAIFMHQRRNPQIAQQQPTPMRVVAVSSSQTPSPIISRRANEYECAILFATSTAHPAPKMIASKPIPNPQPVNPVPSIASSARKNDPAALLAQNDPASIESYLQLVQNTSTRDLALDALRNSDDPPVQLLLAELNAPLVSRRYAAARALGCLCHGPTFTALQQMVERNIDRREAMIALLYCPNPAAKEYLSELRTRPVLGPTLRAVQTEMQTIF